MKSVLAAAIVLAMASTTFAQSPYVAASGGMDLSRFSGVDTPGLGQVRAGGEVASISVRAGTSVGANWGVELGFIRAGALETETSFGYPIPLAAGGLSLSSIFPIIESTTRTERRDSSLETAAWVAQSIGTSVDLVYLGGVSFNRTSEEVRYEIGRRVTGLILPIPNTIRSTTYGVAPLVGFDARIGLTDHVRLVPGIRLQGIGGGNAAASGWIVRPAVGLMWEF
jgi:hypothetical protein